MKPISRIRFDALAGYARHPRSILGCEELGYFEHADERVLGLLIRDRTDNDFAGIVMARDELLQYRWTNMTEFQATERRAKAMLRPALEVAAMAPDEEHHQGHANVKPVDFFTPVVQMEKLNPDFRALIDQEGYASARGIIEPMMRWYNDADGNFVEQFQTTGFDARMWELYLFATLVELGYVVDRTKPAPDFVVAGLNGSFALEAVTVNPTRDSKGVIVPPPEYEDTDDQLAFLREYMPIKFGSALFSKLNKQYWTKAHVRDLPFLLAIEDFSAPGSMTFTQSALQIYLYGFVQEVEGNEGERRIVPRRVASHRWNDKEIPSGFFFLPGCENVSAVMFSNSGTISKFNRMGLIARFGSDRIRMFRRGAAYNHSKDALEPVVFFKDLSDPGYSESWVEGMSVFHNPSALKPLDIRMLPGAAHHFLERDGTLRSLIPEWHPLGSWTIVAAPQPQEVAN